MKARLARLLRNWADRLDWYGAPKRLTSLSFTFENYRGIVVHQDEDRGCPLWYLGESDYERAHTEAKNPAPWIDLHTMAVRDNGWLAS